MQTEIMTHVERFPGAIDERLVSPALSGVGEELGVPVFARQSSQSTRQPYARSGIRLRREYIQLVETPRVPRFSIPSSLLIFCAGVKMAELEPGLVEDVDFDEINHLHEELSTTEEHR